MTSKTGGYRDSWRWKAAAGVLIVVLLAGAVALQYSLEGSTRAAGSGDSAPFDAGRSILDVLGGVRQSLAAVLWTKTDALFHEYFGGDLRQERKVFPYYWLITRLDPHFEMPYYFATYTLCRLGKVKEGFDLALEGIRYNPGSSLLQQNLAEIYLFFKRDPEKALYHVRKAILLSRNDDTSSPLATADPATLERLIEAVIAGEAKIPPLSSLENLKKLNEAQEREHADEHEH